ncbi:MAG TPA: ATP-binding protein [Bacteroidales bacterium]|nr:ATP-binding protein [Bacteroidales bacterium]HSA44767.1 ATP-binding protein [Bacteroidales bacterium]
MAGKFPAISITGPRQSGKTTLVKACFPHYQYFSLEDPDIRLLAEQDPRSFLSGSEKGIILDEVQRLPQLFSYIQGIADTNRRPGRFILTGSQNFLLLENISQSLAGRVAILKLLPLSITELHHAQIKEPDYESCLLKGFYPGLFDRDIEPSDFYPHYLQTYVERDIRMLKNINDLSMFIRFVKMCAGRTGQLVNLSSLANDSGISVPTAKSWISLLEASYIIFLLEPHYRNMTRRLVKAPKLYFTDTGLLCHLLGIKNKEQLSLHYLKGNIFENMIMGELMKAKLNQGLEPSLTFWRDKTGHEVDCILEEGNSLMPVEIKAGRTFQEEYLKGIKYYRKLAGENLPSILIYGGNQEYTVENVIILPYFSAGDAALRIISARDDEE